MEGGAGGVGTAERTRRKCIDIFQNILIDIEINIDIFQNLFFRRALVIYGRWSWRGGCWGVQGENVEISTNLDIAYLA